MGTVRSSAFRWGGILFFLLLSSCADIRARLLFWEATQEGAHGNWEEAFYSFQRIWIEYPQSRYAERAKWMALQIYSGPLSQPSGARHLAQDLVLYGKDPDLRLKALMKFLELLRWESREREAMMILKELFPALPPSSDMRSWAALELARLYISSQNFSSAKDLLEKEQPPPGKKGEWALYFGEVYEGLKDLSRAEESYREALQQLEPGSKLWLLTAQGLVRIYEDKKDPASALKVLESLKEQYPNRMALLSWVHRLEERMSQGVTAP
jgi:tetratricopeptide (TPR) repeat protein